MSTMARPISPPRLLTAEEFCDLFDGQKVELVRGIVEDVEMPKTGLHGKVCLRLGTAILNYADERDCGHVMSNDTWIRTTRDPDSVRGPDLFFISYAQQPKGSVTEEMITGTPELVVEVSSPSDVKSKSLAKILEYFDAGVKVVIQVEPSTKSVVVYRPDATATTFAVGQSLEIPDVLPGFAVPVAKLFA